jgi:hypothetical protein
VVDDKLILRGDQFGPLFLVILKNVIQFMSCLPLKYEM